MGLDVSAYKNLKKVDTVFDGDGEPLDPVTHEPMEDYFRPYVNPDFPTQAQGLENKAVYVYENATWISCGGYGRYNGWRETLAKLAGYPAKAFERFKGHVESSHVVGAFSFEGGPFHELVCFSDCEGVIGPVVSAKLAKDFADFDSQAKAVGEAFYEQYLGWRECFEMAADGGAVDFH
jgi:hypothetical protein